MPVDMAMQEPWAGVVGDEPESGVVRSQRACGHDVANNGVVKVVGIISCTADNMEIVLDEVSW
jgi:hypothetical protein